ncbi:hypothetical protein [Novosphingobium capsulatum]|uniref:hypothetical protein n=1 Tax=Novosphingobium capsulatum TaxID=13688 RepID=UPI001FE1267D|nr:hypothetical protein [Novosphingobium capsulatum]
MIGFGGDHRIPPSPDAGQGDPTKRNRHRQGDGLSLAARQAARLLLPVQGIGMDAAIGRSGHGPSSRASRRWRW